MILITKGDVKMWSDVFTFSLCFMSLHLHNLNAQDIVPAVDQVNKLNTSERPCLLNSESFGELEGGYVSLLEDCNTFDRYGGHPPKFFQNFTKGIAPSVSKPRFG